LKLVLKHEGLKNIYVLDLEEVEKKYVVDVYVGDKTINEIVDKMVSDVLHNLGLHTKTLLKK